MLTNMKKQHVDEWFKYLKGQQFTGASSRREMTLRDLAAKLSEGVGNG